MDIKLKTLYITSYDSSDIEKIRFTKEFKNDIFVQQYLYSCVDEMIEKSEKYPNLHIGCGYIIKDEEDLIGFIRPARIVGLSMLDLDYGVHPKFRNKGYGTKILIEASDYFLENVERIHKIRLSIASSNENSSKCATNAGFIELEEKYPMHFKTYLKRK